jgi:hypothetical protein
MHKSIICCIRTKGPRQLNIRELQVKMSDWETIDSRLGSHWPQAGGPRGPLSWAHSQLLIRVYFLQSRPTVGYHDSADSSRGCNARFPTTAVGYWAILASHGLQRAIAGGRVGSAVCSHCSAGTRCSQCSDQAHNALHSPPRFNSRGSRRLKRTEIPLFADGVT